MTVRVAINGFGRTGRAAFRAAYERECDIEWVAINDAADPEMLAHLLRNDTVYGRFAGEVEIVDGAMLVDGARIAMPSETDPARLPWAELDVDVVIESTGRFRARDDAAKHLEAGARKVVISAPAKNPDVTVALGVNFAEVYDPDVAPHHLECVLHDELPRTRREGAARGSRHPARPDDDRSRLHGRPAAARRAAQGLPSRAHGRLQPRPHHDRCRQGRRSRRPRARGQAPGLCGARPRSDGVARRPDGGGRAADIGSRGERDRLASGPIAAGSRASCSTAKSRSSPPTSSSRRIRRSSMPASRRSSTARRSRSWRGTTTSGGTPTGSSTSCSGCSCLPRPTSEAQAGRHGSGRWSRATAAVPLAEVAPSLCRSTPARR